MYITPLVTWVTSHLTGNNDVTVPRGHGAGVSCRGVDRIFKVSSRRDGKETADWTLAAAAARAQVPESIIEQNPDPDSVAAPVWASPGSEPPGHTGPLPAAVRTALRLCVYVLPPHVKPLDELVLARARCWAPLRWRATSSRTGAAAATTERPRSEHPTPAALWAEPRWLHISPEEKLTGIK